METSVGLVELAEKDRTEHLPPHVLEATRPEAAYPLRRLAGPTALQALAEQTSLKEEETTGENIGGNSSSSHETAETQIDEPRQTTSAPPQQQMLVVVSQQEGGQMSIALPQEMVQILSCMKK